MGITKKEIQDFLSKNETTLKFEKLIKKNEFYLFDDYNLNQNAFYVKFESVKNIGQWNSKKIYFDEIVELFNNQEIRRTDFNRICLNTLKSGGCGFAVIISLLTQMDKGSYLGSTKGFRKNGK